MLVEGIRFLYGFGLGYALGFGLGCCPALVLVRFKKIHLRSGHELSAFEVHFFLLIASLFFIHHRFTRKIELLLLDACLRDYHSFIFATKLGEIYKICLLAWLSMPLEGRIKKGSDFDEKLKNRLNGVWIRFFVSTLI